MHSQHQALTMFEDRKLVKQERLWGGHAYRGNIRTDIPMSCASPIPAEPLIADYPFSLEHHGQGQVKVLVQATVISRMHCLTFAPSSFLKLSLIGCYPSEFCLMYERNERGLYVKVLGKIVQG